MRGGGAARTKGCSSCGRRYSYVEQFPLGAGGWLSPQRGPFKFVVVFVLTRFWLEGGTGMLSMVEREGRRSRSRAMSLPLERFGRAHLTARRLSLLTVSNPRGKTSCSLEWVSEGESGMGEGCVPGQPQSGSGLLNIRHHVSRHHLAMCLLCGPNIFMSAL